MSIPAKQKIVVIGGGFAGLQFVQKLKHPRAEITLVDQRNYHLFQPLLYQVATTILPTSEIAWPIRRILRHRKDVTTLMSEVVGVDRDQNKVILANGKTLPYDILVVATGAKHSYFGNDDWEQVAPGLKTLEDATTIRRRLLKAFELAEIEDEDLSRQALMTFAVIGAGPTGVELAGIIAEIAHKTLWPEFRNIDTRKVKVLLIEAGPKVLSAFPEKLSTYTRKTLEKLGVTVMTGTPVTKCTDDLLIVGQDNIPCRTSIWAAGVAASAAAGWLESESDRAGRVIVDPDLRLPDSPEIFVIGDTASIRQPDGSHVPGVAPAAKQQGKFVARLVRDKLSGKETDRVFHYSNSGNLATIGKRAAVIDFGVLTLKGTIAWWIWGIAHIYFLIGTRSRVAVAWSWLWSYLTGHNNARLITQSRKTIDRSD